MIQMPAYAPSPDVYRLPRGEFDALRQRVIEYLQKLGWQRCAPGYSLDIEIDLVPHGYTLGFCIGWRPGSVMAAALDPDGRPVTNGRARQALAEYQPVPLTAASDLADRFPRVLAEGIAHTACSLQALLCGQPGS